MAPIEDEKSDLYRDHLDSEEPREAVLMKARNYAATGTVVHAADALATSLYLLAELPSLCMLHEDTFVDVEELGAAQVRIGTIDDDDALISQSQATENVITPIAQGDANHGLRLWQVLGLAEDPGGNIGLYMHLIADATGAGSVKFRFSYLWN
ncbi:MAG: hypothetical protein AAFX07_00560 [Pseudomonadota bacterium]